MTTSTGARANVADFRFRMADFETHDLRVAAFDGTEGLGELFEFRIRLTCEDAVIDPEAALGKAAALEIDGEHGTRVIHGIVHRFELLENGSGVAHYEARVGPPHWILTQRSQSRVFNPKRCERMDVIGVVRKVLADAGLREEELQIATIGEYETREFTVQYRESDWNFISRLMEEEGIYFYFDHGPEGCKLVLIDNKAVHLPYVESEDEQEKETAPPVPYRELNELVEEREFVHQANLVGEVRIGSVELDDFNFRRPSDELRTEMNGERFTALHLADYPGNYEEKTRGCRLTEVRLQEEQCKRRVLSLGARVRGFWAGSRFKLVEHPNESFNREYLITHIAHQATQSQSGEQAVVGGDGFRYEARLRVIPAGVQFRPPRITPLALVRGSQTAIVVGPPQEEIHTDEYGRVEVLFHWDQEWPADVGASCWIRVSQGWAGGQYGMMFLPRVGHEVIVDFLEGDPDQPIITGRVYNRDLMPPYSLPGEKTKSTIKTLCSPADKRYHELRFEDKRGAEQLFMRAQRRMDLRVVGPHFHTVGGSLHELIGGMTKDGPKGGYFNTAYENADLRVEEGPLRELIKKFRYVMVDEGDAIDQYQKTYSLFIDEKLESIAKKRIVMQSDTEILLYVGQSTDANFIQISKDGVRIHGKTIWLNDEAAFKADGILGREIDEPLKASPADDGQPGHARRGRGTPRVRQKRLLDGRLGPEVIPPKPPKPPPATKVLTIRARCEHVHGAGPRQVIERQTLHVVPTPDHNYKDMIVLEAESTPPTPKPPHWTIGNYGEADGTPTYFPASPPTAPTARHNWYWNPVAGTKTRYHVDCKDGNGNSEWLEVHAYPEVRKLCLRDQSLLNFLLGAVSKVTDKINIIPGVKFEFGKKVELEGKAGWQEDADPGVSFVYDFTIKAPKLLKVDVGPFSISLAKIARRALPGWITKYLKSISASVEVKGELGFDGRIWGTYRDGKWNYQTTGGATGDIRVSVAVKASAPFDIVSATGTLTGVFNFFGSPVADDNGLGLQVGIGFDGLEGAIEIDIPGPWNPSGSITLWDADKNLFGPGKFHIPLGECGPPPPDIPDVPDIPDFPIPDPNWPFPKPKPGPDPDPTWPKPPKCPSCHDRHPDPNPKPCPDCHDRHPDPNPPKPPQAPDPSGPITA
jgi:type VI secretion system secreted protein VgrG